MYMCVGWDGIGSLNGAVLMNDFLLLKQYFPHKGGLLNNYKQVLIMSCIKWFIYAFHTK